MSELGQSMSAKEYLQWRADYIIEPYGEAREDIRAGMIVQSNLAPHSKEPVKLQDCIVNFEPPKKQVWQDMKSMLFGRSKAMNKEK